MKAYQNIQIVVTVVFFLVMGSISTGFADRTTILKPVQKKSSIKTTPVQKTKPILTPRLKVQRPSDLVISKIKLSPKKEKNSDHISVWVFVKNIGKGKSSPSLLKISPSKKFQPLIPVPALSSNQSWRYTAKVNLSKNGSCNVKATINPEKKIAETNYNNNTSIKNFSFRKMNPKPKKKAPVKLKPKAPGSPPPPSADDIEELELDPAPVMMKSKLQSIEGSLQSLSDVTILEFNVRPEQDGYVWEAVLKNTSSEAFGFWTWFIRVYQISNDGSEQMAGNEFVMGDLARGDTVTQDSEANFVMMTGAVKLRMEVWKNHYSGNHKLITEKVIPFLFLTPVPVEVAPAIKVSIDLIRTLGVQSPGTPAYWQAEVRNIGLGNIAENTLKIKARQYARQNPQDQVLPQPASAPFAIVRSIGPGLHRLLGTKWTPIEGCTHLEIIVMGNNNKVLAYKLHPVEFP